MKFDELDQKIRFVDFVHYRSYQKPKILSYYRSQPVKLSRKYKSTNYLSQIILETEDHGDGIIPMAKIQRPLNGFVPVLFAPVL